MRLAHFIRFFPGFLDLNQRTFSDAGAPLGSLAPLLFVVHQLGPEGEQTALGWFGGVNRAAVSTQETALGVSWHTQTAEIGRAVNESTFELPLRKAEETGGADDVVFG